MTRKAHVNGGDLFLLNCGTKAVMAQPSKSQIPTKEMVQAVRECAPDRSNHEIHLVLQYYDYNVQTAIQAFLDDGAVEALKDWHHAGNAKNQSKQRGKKAKNKSAQLQQLQQLQQQQTDDTASAAAVAAAATAAPAPLDAQLNTNGCLSDVSSANVQSGQQTITAGDLTTEQGSTDTATVDPAGQHAQQQISGSRDQLPDSIHSSTTDPSLLQHRGSLNLPAAEKNCAVDTATVGCDGADDRCVVAPVAAEVSMHSLTTPHDSTRVSRHVPTAVAGKNTGSSGSSRPSSAAAAASAADSPRGQPLGAAAGMATAGAGRGHIAGHVAGHPSAINAQHSLVAHNKPHAGLEKSIKDLHRQTVSLSHLQLHFNEEYDKSLKKIKAVFEQLRSGLNDREADLMYQLDKAKGAGGEIFTSRMNKAAELKMLCDRCPGALVHAVPGSNAAHLAEQQLANLRNDIKHFVSERKVDEELSRTSHFIVSDTGVAELLTAVQNLGEVVPARNGYSSTRRLSSSSACSGTEGDDTNAKTERRPQQQQHAQQPAVAAGTAANGSHVPAAVSGLASVKSAGRPTSRGHSGSTDSGTGRVSAATSDVASSGTAATATVASATSAAGHRAAASANEDKRSRAAAPHDVQRPVAAQLPQQQRTTGSSGVPFPPSDKDAARIDHTQSGGPIKPVTTAVSQAATASAPLPTDIAASVDSESSTVASATVAPAPAVPEPEIREQSHLLKRERSFTETGNQQVSTRDWSDQVVESSVKQEWHGRSNGYTGYSNASGRAANDRYREAQRDSRGRGSHRSYRHYYDDDHHHSFSDYDGGRASAGRIGSRVIKRSPSGSNGSYYREPRTGVDSQRWQQRPQSPQADARRYADSRTEPIAAAAAEPSKRLHSATAADTENRLHDSRVAPKENGTGAAAAVHMPSSSPSENKRGESGGSFPSTVRGNEGGNGKPFRSGKNRGGRHVHGRSAAPAASGDPMSTSSRFEARRDEEHAPSSLSTSGAGAAVGVTALPAGDPGDKASANSGSSVPGLGAPERVKSYGHSGGYRGGRGRGFMPAGDRSAPGDRSASAHVAAGGNGSAEEALPQRQVFPRRERGRHGGPTRTSATHSTNDGAPGGSSKGVNDSDRSDSSFSATTAAGSTAPAAAGAAAAVGPAGAQE